MTNDSKVDYQLIWIELRTSNLELNFAQAGQGELTSIAGGRHLQMAMKQTREIELIRKPDFSGDLLDGEIGRF